MVTASHVYRHTRLETNTCRQDLGLVVRVARPVEHSAEVYVAEKRSTMFDRWAAFKAGAIVVVRAVREEGVRRGIVETSRWPAE